MRLAAGKLRGDSRVAGPSCKLPQQAATFPLPIQGITLLQGGTGEGGQFRTELLSLLIKAVQPLSAFATTKMFQETHGFKSRHKAVMGMSGARRET
jgi:hypothetical protein